MINDCEKFFPDFSKGTIVKSLTVRGYTVNVTRGVQNCFMLIELFELPNSPYNRRYPRCQRFFSSFRVTGTQPPGLASAGFLLRREIS